MLAPVEALSKDSKIWIYQSDRAITPEEEVEIKTTLEDFVQKWTAHSNELKAAVQIKHDYFVVISVDESHNNTSGCSIDALFREISTISETHKIDFFNRENLAFMIDDKVQIVPLNEIGQYINNGNINIQSNFFNNLATSLGELDSNWVVPVEKTWLKKYF